MAGKDIQQCIVFDFKNNCYTDIDRDTKHCTICEFNGEVHFHLHGLEETSLMDKRYIFVPQIQAANELLFIGHKQYQMSWFNKATRWQIFDRSDLTKPVGYHTINDDKTIVGKYDWCLYSDACSTSSNEGKVTLKFSKVSNILVFFRLHLCQFYKVSIVLKLSIYFISTSCEVQGGRVFMQ